MVVACVCNECFSSVDDWLGQAKVAAERLCADCSAGQGEVGRMKTSSAAMAESDVRAATALLSRSLFPINLRKPETKLLLFLVCLRFGAPFVAVAVAVEEVA